MKILYIADAIQAGGSSGGWTHVTEVACGLRALGHEVYVVARASKSGAGSLPCDIPLHLTRLPQQLAFLGVPEVARIARQFRPDVIMERFYNFAGAGAIVARRRKIPLLLEVNAPMTDPPGSVKSRLDTLLLGAMRRWATRQARWSSAIVTPLSSTVPRGISRRKIHELPWGANIEMFNPGLREARRDELLTLKTSLGLDARVPVAVFLGSFRAWHGAAHFVEAARRLLLGNANLSFLCVGGGPELDALKAEVASLGLARSRFVFTGPQPHERVPDLLGIADIGVAPFSVAAHPPLVEFGFYWSPLKVFEYMAMSLPVVTIDVHPLDEIVRDEREGLLYRSGDIAGLVRALGRLAASPEQRTEMGAAARLRVAQRYSWAAHCIALDRLLRTVLRDS